MPKLQVIQDKTIKTLNDEKAYKQVIGETNSSSISQFDSDKIESIVINSQNKL